MPWNPGVRPAPGTSAYGEPAEVECEDCDITVEGKKPKPKKPKDRPEEPVEWFPPAVEVPFPAPSLPAPGAPGGPPVSGGPAPGGPAPCVDVVDVVQQFTMKDLTKKAVCDEAKRWLEVDMTVACWERGGEVTKEFTGGCAAMDTSLAPGKDSVYLGSVFGELTCCVPTR